MVCRGGGGALSHDLITFEADARILVTVCETQDPGGYGPLFAMLVIAKERRELKGAALFSLLAWCKA